MDKLPQRYTPAENNRAFFLADSMIRLRSYEWSLIDRVAAKCSDEQIAAFCTVIELLNKESES